MGKQYSYNSRRRTTCNYSNKPGCRDANFRPEVLVCYDLGEGVTADEEETLFLAHPELIIVGEISLEEVNKPHLTECNQVVAKWDNTKNTYPDQFYNYEEGSIQVDEQPAQLRTINLNITGWTIPEGEELLLLNLGTEKPKNVKVNAKLDHSVIREAEQLFKEYKDIFAWSYHDLLGIPKSIYQHRIELET